MKADYTQNFLYSQIGGCKMNSHRDNVKDAIKSCFVSFESGDYANELACEIEAAVFNALGITRDEQDKCGGYFMLHAEKRPEQWGYICFKCKEIKHRAEVTRCVVPEEAGEFTSTMNTVEDAENEYTRRTKELAEGAKYTAEEFKSYAVGRVTGGTPCNWYITLQTPIYGYSQMYSETYTLEEAKSVFVDFYYPVYLKDYERSTDVDEMDEE